MAELKILVYKAGASEPDSKVVVPLRGADLTARIVAGAAAAALEKEGIEAPPAPTGPGRIEPRGTLIEVESEAERIVVAIE